MIIYYMGGVKDQFAIKKNYTFYTELSGDRSGINSVIN